MTPETNDFIELEMDAPTARKIVPSIPEDQIELDLADTVNPTCRRCSKLVAVNVDGYCERCYETRTGRPANPDAFADIAAESVANAQQANLGELANGRATLGVGFNSADGYVTALRRGVLAHTRTEYEQILQNKYGFTPEAITAIGAQTIAQDLPVGEGIVHNAGANIDSAVAAIKAHAAKSPGLNIVAPVEVERVRVHLAHGDVVAGSVAEGNGILTHWSGSGPLTVAQITAIGDAAGIPSAWLPRAKDSKTYANHAVAQVGRALGFSVTKEKRDWSKEDQSYDHRWRLYTTADGAFVGDAAGTVALVVSLKAGLLTCEGHEEASELIAHAYADLLGREVLQAGHITTWLGNLIRDRLDGVKYGGCWYVPRHNRALAERIVDAFAAAQWGSDWMNPPTPIATSAQLARGIANGLATEVDATLVLLDSDNAACAQTAATFNPLAADNARKPLGHIGEKAAATYLKKFRAHAERVKLFAALLGPALVAESRVKVETATAKLAEYTDDGMGIGERFAAVWDEIQFDADKAGEVLPE